MYQMNVHSRWSGTKNKSGFTLIELLVVVAIIALLAAILFPVFARARENARRSSCQSNLKQIGLSVFQYTQDYDETMPLLFSQATSNSMTKRNTWQTVQPYVKNTQLFTCPSDTTTANTLANSPHWGNQDSDAPAELIFPVSYAVNLKVCRTYIDSSTSGTTLISAPSIRLASIVNSAGTVLACDGATTFSSTSPPEQWTDRVNAWTIEYGVVTSGSNNRGAPAARHLETGNVLFMDGHVKSLRTEKWYTSDRKWLDPAVGGP